MTIKNLKILGISLLLCFAIMVLLLPAAYAGVIYVNPAGSPNDGATWATGYASIADAITAASPTDEIWVLSGVYLEALDVSKNITLLGGFVGTETSSDERDWQTNETIIDANGGLHAVNCTASAPIIDGFTLTGGDTGGGTLGGGVYCSGTSPTVRNCRIKDNDSSNWGAGIGVDTSGSPRFENCLILSNNHYASGSTGGGGAAIINASITFINCTFSQNYSAAYGGAVYKVGTGTATLYNCILWDDSADTSGDEIFDGSTSVNVYYSDIGDGFDVGSNGNINIDPLLVGDDSYYHIEWASPCRDSGTDTVAGGLPSEDIDGDPREVGMVDMGADEYFDQPTAGDYYVNIASGSDSGDGSAALPWKTLHHALFMINLGEAGEYVLNVAAGTYSIGNGEDDSDLLITQDQMTITGAGAGSTILDGASAATWVNGFTVQADDTAVSGMSIHRFGSSGIQVDSADGSDISGLTIYNNGSVGAGAGSGIRISNSAANTLISGNDIYWTGDTSYTQEVGIEIENSSSATHYIYGNKIHGHNDSWDYRGIYVWGQNAEIKRNEIYDNYLGIYLFDGTIGTSHLIENNLIYETSDIQQYGIYVSAVSSNVAATIRHNTIVGGDMSGIFSTGSGAQSPD